MALSRNMRETQLDNQPPCPLEVRMARGLWKSAITDHRNMLLNPSAPKFSPIINHQLGHAKIARYDGIASRKKTAAGCRKGSLKIFAPGQHLITIVLPT